ncbi:MAG: hypothetical protein Sapg2KO_48250 [Saprospiraceae bacterium]
MTANLNAQQKSLQFDFTVQDQTLELGVKYYCASIADSIQIDRLKLYIGHLAFWKGNKEVYRLEQKYLLLDAEAPESLSIAIPSSIDFDQIRFQFGVDSLTNVAGVQGGALDPTQGMYWAWQSGYINFKLEGETPVCPARNNRFQYHLGGFQAPFGTAQMVQIEIPDSTAMHIHLPLEELFKQLDLRNQYQIMSPRKEAVQLAEVIADLFKAVYED